MSCLNIDSYISICLQIYHAIRKGYPHSMIILAYFRIKFSSLKMNNDRVLLEPNPGSDRCAARDVACPREPSVGPDISTPSRFKPAAVNDAILKTGDTN